MKKPVSVRDYIAYRDRTKGCMDVEIIYFTLRDKESNEVLLDGSMFPDDKAKAMVLGTHPSGNSCSSVVLATIDLQTNAIHKSLESTVTKRELESVALKDSGNVEDGVAQTRRAKAITWIVQYIDEDTNEVWVEGVI